MIVVLESALNFVALCEEKYDILRTTTRALLFITPKFPHYIFHGRNKARFLLCRIYPSQRRCYVNEVYMTQM